MTVLSRGARGRRGGRRPGWVLLTTLLVLAIGASSALVFTNRVELLKLAVILALWAAVAGAFVSVLYRRQADADQARARDMKLVYDLQLDREISARREYELTVESQLRRELASELRGAAADEVAALRAELSALRTSLEILFDTDLEHRPALETLDKDTGAARALADRSQNGETPPADWVSSDRIAVVHQAEAASRADEAAIIDVPEEPLLPPRQPTHAREYTGEQVRPQYAASPPPPPPAPAPEPAEPIFGPVSEPRHRPPQQPPPQMPPPQMPPQPVQPQPQPSEWQPVAAAGQWWPPATPRSPWAPAASAPPGPPVEPPAEPPTEPTGRRRRARQDSPAEQGDSSLDHLESAPQYPQSGRRSRSRHSAEYRDFGVGSLVGAARGEPPPPAPEPVAPAPAPAAAPQPPRLAPAPPPEFTPRHRSAEPVPEDSDGSEPQTGGQSVADLMARLQVQPSGGGRRRRRDG